MCARARVCVCVCVCVRVRARVCVYFRRVYSISQVLHNHNNIYNSNDGNISIAAMSSRIRAQGGDMYR